MLLTAIVTLAGCGGDQGGVSVTSAVPAPTIAPVRTPGASGGPEASAPQPSTQLSSGDTASAIAAAAQAAQSTPAPSRPSSQGVSVGAGGSVRLSVGPAAQQTAQAQRLPAAARLAIPEIGVDAPLVPLGVDASGVMEVPNNGTDVGWYTFSAVPGSPGNAILSGHVDTTTSYTAVFYRLKELKIGDPLSVIVNGRKIEFQVFWTKAWPDDQAPLPLILGNAPSPTLTLITCSGTFDRNSKNYSARLVVRAKLPGTT